MIGTATTIFRYLIGIVLMVWVGMGVVGWQPPPVEADAEALRNAIFASGYIIPAVMIVYFVTGLAYLANRYVALASVMLFPVSLNILLFHTILNPHPRSVSIASALFVANCLMLYQSRMAYSSLLRDRL
jgi:putative oxidoreductase